MKFLVNVGDPSYFPASLPDCLCHVSFIRYSPLSVEVVENRTNVKVSWPPFFFLGDDPNRSTTDCKRDLPSAVWQSLAKFCLLIYVCEAWQ